MGAFAVPYVWLVGLMLSCHATTPPQPDVVPGGLPTIEVYEEVVDAGCLAPDDSGQGLASIAVDHLDGGKPWLECLFAGGTVQACASYADAGELSCGASGKR